MIVYTAESLLKLGPVDESDKEQLKRFCNACKGIPQVKTSFNCIYLVNFLDLAVNMGRIPISFF